MAEIIHTISHAWQQARPIILLLLGAITLSLFITSWLSLFLVLILVWLFYFFRDPIRNPESSDPLAILSPADGTITQINQLDHAPFLDGPSAQISIFLSIFDVHVQRAPYAGRVEYINYQPGTFKPAFLQHADTNESNSIGLNTIHGKLLIKQMTGILARRIVCIVKRGDKLSTNQKLGLIKFGSRVDIFLPHNTKLNVNIGQKVTTGQTVIANWTKK